MYTICVILYLDIEVIFKCTPYMCSVNYFHISREGAPLSFSSTLIIHVHESAILIRTPSLMVDTQLVTTANPAHLPAQSTLVRATNGKKIVFINGTKFKSVTLLNHQAALAAEVRAAAVLTEFIVNAGKNVQTDSAVTTVLINVKRVVFTAKKKITEASMDKDGDMLKNLVDDHRECQLLTKQFITLAER
jgi:hypothetical protein